MIVKSIPTSFDCPDCGNPLAKASDTSSVHACNKCGGVWDVATLLEVWFDENDVEIDEEWI